MYLHKVESMCGRPVPKPRREEADEEDQFDKTVTIQDQIEALRTKIQLKERYNRVLQEQFEDTSQGTTLLLANLYRQNRELNVKLVDTLKGEENAVRIALRSYRLFQMSMGGRNTFVAIPWLEDKLFTKIKMMNCLMSMLTCKRAKLVEAEDMIVQIEKWPIPGTLPWEIAALDRFLKLENYIERMKVKAELGFILNRKYTNIKYILIKEQGKYLPTLTVMENKLNQDKKELESLQQMMEEASYFRADAEKDFHLTEREALDNRRQRRRKMGKVKRSMQRALSLNDPGRRATVHKPVVYFEAFRKSGQLSQIDQISIVENVLKRKKERVELFTEKARSLVEAMRVKDLTKVTPRFLAVRALGKQLEKEMIAKENLRNLLVKQKNQLILLVCHFRYSGAQKLKEHQAQIKKFAEDSEKTKNKIAELKKRLFPYGNVFVHLRLILLSIFIKLDDRKRYTTVMSKSVKFLLKLLLVKVKKLTQAVEVAKAPFGDKPPLKNYEHFVGLGTHPPRLLRVEIAEEEEGSESEDDLTSGGVDLKVPTRQDIKKRSQQKVREAIIARGLK